MARSQHNKYCFLAASPEMPGKKGYHGADSDALAIYKYANTTATWDVEAIET